MSFESSSEEEILQCGTCIQGPAWVCGATRMVFGCDSFLVGPDMHEEIEYALCNNVTNYYGHVYDGDRYIFLIGCGTCTLKEYVSTTELSLFVKMKLMIDLANVIYLYQRNGKIIRWLSFERLFVDTEDGEIKLLVPLLGLGNHSTMKEIQSCYIYAPETCFLNTFGLSEFEYQRRRNIFEYGIVLLKCFAPSANVPTSHEFQENLKLFLDGKIGSKYIMPSFSEEIPFLIRRIVMECLVLDPRMRKIRIEDILSKMNKLSF